MWADNKKQVSTKVDSYNIKEVNGTSRKGKCPQKWTGNENECPLKWTVTI